MRHPGGVSLDAGWTAATPYELASKVNSVIESYIVNPKESHTMRCGFLFLPDSAIQQHLRGGRIGQKNVEQTSGEGAANGGNLFFANSGGNANRNSEEVNL